MGLSGTKILRFSLKFSADRDYFFNTFDVVVVFLFFQRTRRKEERAEALAKNTRFLLFFPKSPCFSGYFDVKSTLAGALSLARQN